MLRSRPVDPLRSLTFAPVTRPPDGSPTTPAMLPLGVWALQSAMPITQSRAGLPIRMTIAYRDPCGVSTFLHNARACPCRSQSPHCEQNLVARPADIGQPHRNGRSRHDAV